MSGMNELHDGTEHDHEAQLDKYKLPKKQMILPKQAVVREN